MTTSDQSKKLHGISLFGDLKYPGDFSHFDYVNPIAPKGGSMCFGINTDYEGLSGVNKFIVDGAKPEVLRLLYDTLLAPAQDESSAQYALLAEFVEKPADSDWIIFHINQAARFQDGSAVTADDVLFSYETLISKDADPDYREALEGIAKYEKIDALTVKFHFKDKNRNLPLALGQLTVFSKAHALAQKNFNSITYVPLGSGPYKMKEVVLDSHITLMRDPDYWAQNLPVAKGQYNSDFMQERFYEHDEESFQHFQTNTLDIRVESRAKNWATLYDFPAVAQGLVKKEQLENSAPGNFEALFFNLRPSIGKFQDVRVRQAITLCHDFAAIDAQLFHGAYTKSDSYFPNSRFASLNPKPLQGPSNLDSINQADQLLRDAGYVKSGGYFVDD